uniref:Uncharacterized protein n=1 Tax=Nicotiana tabacum TaxID=4097 RepID=A0A1S4D5J4_TOBAC|nr:PREDICTED: uncharacterized protein LOC107826213 [Nicotiana tabacum]
MAPYEALYGRKFTSPIGWVDVRESRLHRPDLVQQAIEKVKLIQELLLTTQSRQKSYSDMRRQDLEFGVDDWAFTQNIESGRRRQQGTKRSEQGQRKRMRVSRSQKQSQGSYRSPVRAHGRQVCSKNEVQGRHGHFCRSATSVVEDTWANAEQCIGDATPVVPTDDVQITEDLSYEKVPVSILDRQICKLRNKELTSVKVLSRSKNVEEMIWEAEGEMKSKYPHLFQTEDMSRDGILQHCSI